MKKVIGGKVYDTDTAKSVWSWDNGLMPGDLDWYGEELYLKRTGEHFLLLQGGARSPMARATGCDSWSGGWQIVPASYSEARRWAEGHMDADAFQEAFGPVGEGQAVVNSPVSAEAKARLVREAQRRGVSQAEIVEDLLMGLPDAGR